MDEKADRYIVNGAFTAEDLQSLLARASVRAELSEECHALAALRAVVRAGRSRGGAVHARADIEEAIVD